jgi:hypothetical protein
MSTPSRTAQYAKVLKVLKKYYKPIIPNPERPILEHLLFACCLENAHYEPAEEALATLVHTFFDWNEIRVTTVKELSEVLSGLPDPAAAATRVKRALQHVFETAYCFDLEELRKKTIGQAIEKLEKTHGVSKFGCGYVVQAALGGHSIPIDSGTMGALRVLDLVTDKDVQSQAVPGLERAIAKNKGVEFAGLLHQLGADFTANPYSPNLHKILLQINPDIAGQLPKRRPKPAPEETRPAASDAKAAKTKEKAKGKPEAPAAAKPAAVAEETKKKSSAEPAAAATKPVPATPATKTPAAPPAKPAAGKTAASAPAKSAAETHDREKKAAADKKKPPTLKKVADDAATESPKRSSTMGLSKKKPR